VVFLVNGPKRVRLADSMRAEAPLSRFAAFDVLSCAPQNRQYLLDGLDRITRSLAPGSRVIRD
jgi:hypothetical protein